MESAVFARFGLGFGTGGDGLCPIAGDSMWDGLALSTSASNSS